MPTMSIVDEHEHLKKRREALREEEKKLEKKWRESQVRMKARDRKLDTRRKIVAGALTLDLVAESDRIREWFIEQLWQDHVPDRDRILFDDLLTEDEIAACKQRIKDERARKAAEREAEEAAKAASARAATTYTQPPSDPQAAAILGSAPAPEPEPVAAAEPAPATVSPEDALAAAKLRLQDMLADSLREAEIENTDANIVALVEALCAQMGITREDLTDPGTVESLIALQKRSPVDAKAAAGAPSPSAEPEAGGQGDPAGP